MEGSGWQSIAIGDVEPIAVAGVGWRPLRRVLGIDAFGLNAYVGGPGEHVVEEHTEETLGHQEAYVVVAGRATFTVAGESTDAPAGTVVFIRDPALRRSAVAQEPGTTVLAIGAPPGEAYVPSAWEAYFAVERFRATGEHRLAIAELEEALARFPDSAGVLYSLACWEALAGDADPAVEHVRRAIELDPRFADWSHKDEDLASIRDRLPQAPDPGPAASV